MATSSTGGGAVRSRREDFEKIKRLGAGSFGTVYQVRRHADGGMYAMKTIRITELTDRERIEAIKEVKLLASIDSSYIVRYFDSFIHKDSLSIIMEFCNMGDLTRLLKKKKDRGEPHLNNVVVWNLILQILLGLQYLHSMKVLHRDLKSANVFLCKDEAEDVFRVKIGDLGVAKLLETSTAFARTIVGTPYYLSPELCEDKPYRDKSDVWAFGVLLYECCSFRHPFEAKNQCALILKIIQSPFTPLTETDLLPPDLVKLIDWTLKKDPSARPTVRDILCESTVRRQMSMHGFAVPEELKNAPLLHILPSSIKKSFARDTAVQPQIDGVSSHDGTVSRAVSSGGGASLRPIMPSKAPVKPPVSASVRGDRVRGPTKAVTSQKARIIHQRPLPQLQRTSSKNDPHQNYAGNEDKNTDSKLSPEDRALLDALHPAASQAKLTEGEYYSSNDEEFEDTLIPGSQHHTLEADEDEDNPYADDRFEAEVDDESELFVAPSGTAASSYVDSQLRTEMKYVDAILSDENEIDILPDADRDSEAKTYDHGIDVLARSVKEDASAKEVGDSPQWGSLWSINRGDLQNHGETVGDDQSGSTVGVEPANPRELMDFSALAPSISEPDSPANSMYVTLPEPSVVALSDQRDLISRKLHEATDRFIRLLGPELYEQAYYLCLEHMAPSGNSLRSKTRLYDPDDSDVMIHSDAKMIQDLEYAMKSKLNGSVDMAREAILGIKFILALESRRDALDEAMTHGS